MRTRVYILACLFGALLLTSCKNDGAGDSPEALPVETLEKLRTSCDYVDIIFYNSSASMSQDEARAIQATIGYISELPALPQDGCQPAASLAFMGDGEILANANVYCTDGCAYLEFMEDQKPIYYNGLTRTGVQFFTGILKYLPAPQ